MVISHFKILHLKNTLFHAFLDVKILAISIKKGHFSQKISHFAASRFLCLKKIAHLRRNFFFVLVILDQTENVMLFSRLPMTKKSKRKTELFLI